MSMNLNPLVFLLILLLSCHPVCSAHCLIDSIQFFIVCSFNILDANIMRIVIILSFSVHFRSKVYQCKQTLIFLSSIKQSDIIHFPFSFRIFFASVYVMSHFSLSQLSNLLSPNISLFKISETFPRLSRPFFFHRYCIERNYNKFWSYTVYIVCNTL